MADSKISDLPAAGALTGAEIFPIVQSGVTKQEDLDAISAKVVDDIEIGGIGSFIVSGNVTAQKFISNLSGYQFPDGTVMTSAAATAVGMTSSGSLTFASNTDGVGIGDTIFSTNTVERMRITTSSGFVGIGYANPLNNLHVKGVIRISSNETATTQKFSELIASQYDSASETEGYTIIGGQSQLTENEVKIGGGFSGRNASSYISFHTSTGLATRTGTVRMVIDGNGNVGIGNATPLNILHVAGKVRISENETDATNKEGTILGSQYSSAAESEGYTGMHLSGISSDNIVSIGGGETGRNAATIVNFYTGATTATSPGSARMKVASDGGVFMFALKSGTTQALAGASENELWVDTDDDYTIKLGQST